MRVARLLIIGIALGTLGGIYLVNALHQRNPVPRAMMVMMQYHLGQLEHQAQAGACPADANSTSQLTQLAVEANDIGSVFNGFDARFAHFTRHLQQRISQATATRSLTPNCATLRQQLGLIQQTCDACHRQYR